MELFTGVDTFSVHLSSITPFGTCEPVDWEVVNFSVDLNAKCRVIINNIQYEVSAAECKHSCSL